MERFRQLQKVMLNHLGRESFDEFGVPSNETVLIIGRIQLESEDENASAVSLINPMSESGVMRLPLKLQSIGEYFLINSEVVVMEGFNDSNRYFTPSQTFKPPIPSYVDPNNFLSRVQSIDNKPTSIIVASGPFMFSNVIDFTLLCNILNYMQWNF